jgi:hypothetical protein
MMRRIKKKLAEAATSAQFMVLFLMAWPAFAGQSLVIGNLSGTQAASNASIPSVNVPFCKAVAWDVVPQTLVNSTFYFIAGNPFSGNALPLDFEAVNAGGGIQLAVTFLGETGSTGLPGFQINGTAGNAIWGWACHDMAAFGGTNTDYVAFYDRFGNNVGQASQTYSSIATVTSTGWQVLGGMGADAFHIAFERICIGEAAIPLWKTIPTTFGGCPLGTELLEWKFDGNLNDSSGNGYTSSISGSGGTTPAYTTTNYQGVTAIIKTVNNPVWSPIVSVRAGNPNQLDGSASYSQSDTSNTVGYFWQSLSGPNTPVFSSHTDARPFLTGAIFGDYLIQLTATDSAGDTTTATVDIGAVATDTDGVVVQTYPAADYIFGPMIAWGRNPWGLQDSLSKTMVDQQYIYQGCCTPPSWTINGQGTVGYIFCGVAGSCGTGGTSTTSSVTATTLSVPIANASALDLSALPTTVLVDSEVMLVTATTATSGAATLTIGYNGRGLQGGGLYATAATTHSNAARVGQFKVTGTSTLFETDPNTPICPSGAGSSTLPAPAGRIVYQTGSVTMTPGSTSVTGVGTTWTNGNGVGTGQNIIVYATHAGGTAFHFISPAFTLNGTTSITLSTPYPSDADAGIFTYAIVQYRNPSLGYTRTDGSIGRTLQNGIQVCIGNLQMGGLPGHDYGTAYNSTAFSSQNYSYKDFLGSQSAFGPNFYGTGLAARAHYLRSGYGKALQLANFVDDYWVRDPELDGGYAGGEILLQGGAVIGAFADLTTNPNSLLLTADKGTASGAYAMRGFVGKGSQVTTENCWDDDTRDTGYFRALTALAAKFDTGTFQSSWRTQLEAIYNNHDVGGHACKQTDNSFSNAFLMDASAATPNVPNSGYAPLRLTTGSATASDNTGLGITPDRCSIAASGTISVTNGSGAATDLGQNFIDPNVNNYGRRLIIHGTKNSGATPYVGVFSYLFNSSSSITLNGQWPGDTGSFTYVIENTGFPTTIGASQADSANLTVPWACTWVNSSTITLDRPWTQASGVYNLYQSPGRPFGYGIGGYGQQPFMLGIAVTGIGFASKVGDGSYDANWLTLGQNAASWLWNNAYDPYSQGIKYGAVYGGCDLKVPVSATVGFILGTSAGNGGNCQVDSLPNGGINFARSLAVEALESLSTYYQSNPSPPMRAFGDTVYGSIFASNTLTTGGVYAPADNNPGSNQSFAAYKWPGFYFGMGMSHQWPAVRQGGVQPALNRTLKIGVCLGSCPGSVPGATSLSVVLTAPSGVVSTTACSSSPCSVVADARQGSYLLVVKYLSPGAKVLAKSDPQSLAVQ